MSLVDPQSNVESYLANLNGESTPLPLPPESNVEKYLAKMAGVQDVELPHKPESRVEVYLEQLALNPPSPGEVTVRPLAVTQNGTYSEEGIAYSPVNVNVQPTLAKKTISENGTYKASEDSADGYSEVEVAIPDPILDDITITENGVYTSEHDGFDEVTVSVQPPENSYQLKSITTPTSLATFNASAMPMPNLKVSVEAQQDLHGYDKPWVGGAGYNKWDEEWDLGGIDPSTGQDVSGNLVRSKNYIAVSADTTYYFKGVGRVFFYDNQKNYISRLDRDNNVFTTPNDCKYIRFRMDSSYGTTYNNDISINYPSSVTTYSPYSNICPISGWDNAIVTDTDDVDNPTVTQTTTISLGQTVYGGELDVVNGTSGNKITYGFVDLSTLTGWLKGNNDRFATSALSDVIADVESTSTVADLMCSHYEPVSFNDANTRHMGIYEHPNKSIGIYDESMSDYTVEQFLAAISGVQLRYPLATPTTLTTQPTPIKSLNGTNNLSVDCGDVIEVEYFKAL